MCYIYTIIRITVYVQCFEVEKFCIFHQGRSKQFYIGQAESLDNFECMENVATHTHTGYL